jgi:hypothetical protein
MKRFLFGYVLLTFLFLSSSLITVSGQYTVASWSYDALVAPTATVPTASVIGADYGILYSNATTYLDGTNGSSAWISGLTNPELTTFSGSTINDPRAVPNAGNALAIANSSANGKSLIFKFPTLGFSGISISFATRGTSTGFNTHTWEWSTDNVTYTGFGTNTAVTSSTFTQKSIDMSAITAINNNSTVYIKLTVTGASSAAGNNRIDNFVVSATSDIGAPVATFNPLNTAVDVPVTVTPTITFDEPVRKTDGNPLENDYLSTLITFKKTDASGTNVPFTATIDAAKKVITVTPSASLDNSQAYYLAVGAVEDASGNEATAKNITFTTIAAATPTITLTSPLGGEIMYANSAQTITWTSANITNVFIEVWAPDGVTRTWSWIPFVPSTPASPGKADITVPPNAPYGTDYKIRVSDLSNPSVASTGGKFTVIAVATSIADLRARSIKDDIVLLNSSATMTFKRATGNQKYIQDASSGLLIYDPSAVLTTTLNEGDAFNGLEGKLDLYGGVLEIIPTKATVTVTSSGNTVTIPELTIADYNTNYLLYESRLVKFKVVTFPGADGSAVFNTTTSSPVYSITDGTNSVAFYTFKSGEGNIVGSVIPIGSHNVTALAMHFNTTPEIASRTTADLEFLTAVEKTSASALVIYPVPAGDMLMVRNVRNVRNIDILDVTGRLIRSSNISNDNEINIPVSNLKKGIYFLRITTPEGRIIRKFIK